ncbi:uncharacterized protein [Antedon mediterranea]|uniref:uncharacterized protein n=1 Tax=Antedon mediterranea TaxID=105859 RepID=UPI003AF8DD88
MNEMDIRPVLRKPEFFLESWFMEKLLSHDLTEFDESFLSLPMTNYNLNRSPSRKNGDLKLVIEKTCERRDSYETKDKLPSRPRPTDVLLKEEDSKTHVLISSPQHRSTNLRRPLEADITLSPISPKFVRFEDEEKHRRRNIEVGSPVKLRERPLPSDLASLELDKLEPNFQISQYLNDAIVNCDWEIKRLLFSLLAEKTHINLDQYIVGSLDKKQISDKKKTNIQTRPNNDSDEVDVALIRNNVLSKAVELGWTTESTISKDLGWTTKATTSKVVDLGWTTEARTSKVVDLGWTTEATTSKAVELDWTTKATTSKAVELGWTSEATTSLSINESSLLDENQENTTSNFENNDSHARHIFVKLSEQVKNFISDGKALLCKFNLRNTKACEEADDLIQKPKSSSTTSTTVKKSPPKTNEAAPQLRRSARLSAIRNKFIKT